MSNIAVLDVQDRSGIESYLKARRWIAESEEVERVERAGEGNMNCTLRVTVSERTFILKQARPWVEKYPQIAAPVIRAEMEARFYREVSKHARLADCMPRLLDFDALSRVLMLEDLGNTQDCTFLYRQKGLLEEIHLHALVAFLADLHTSFSDKQLESTFRNDEMRALNHEHIFALPLRKDNGLKLDAITPGLDALARELQKDETYGRKVAALGEIYLSHPKQGCLLHGDFFPGSWLSTTAEIFIIDPEFCFFGPAEFDLGIMVGHLYLAGFPPQVIENTLALYGNAAPLQRCLALNFAGVEIMRRLIGVAQLPLACGLEGKRQLLELSRILVLDCAC